MRWLVAGAGPEYVRPLLWTVGGLVECSLEPEQTARPRLLLATECVHHQAAIGWLVDLDGELQKVTAIVVR
jgi:hypothetical protein